MRVWTIGILIALAAAAGAAQGVSACQTLPAQMLALQKEYKFAEMETLADRGVAECDIVRDAPVFHQAALTYLWRGQLKKAQPIVEKLSSSALKESENARAAALVGISRTLPLMSAVYSGADDKVEEMLVDFENMQVKSQEVALLYLLRKNDPRFLKMFAARKTLRLDYSPILCRLYCKKNAVVQDCPCAGATLPASQGGPYSIYLDYLNGKPADELKKEIETRYGQVPLLKKEIMQCLGF